ncbi:MAG: 4Fe-4S dicluster domain-containing protein [Cyclobacteriaceae bacterium]|nr:4Fe-4S dicluster domain-containing protein [Cyclobacteriaceae bacterium]
MSGYFATIQNAMQTLSSGLKLTLAYLWDARHSRDPIGVEDPSYFDQDKGIATLQYPYESLPVPETGRYRLHNEIDDCIVCDKCAKICPVNCIDIEPVKAVEEIGKTSDGTTRRIYAAKFDIDMAKCCFCGLCTTVCPTECLTMTNVYDFSEFDVRDHLYSFAEMSRQEIREKRHALEAAERTRDAEKQAVQLPPDASVPKARPVFRPKVKPADSEASEGVKPAGNEVDPPPKPRPVFRPKPMIKRKPDTE